MENFGFDSLKRLKEVDHLLRLQLKHNWIFTNTTIDLKFYSTD